MRQEKNFEPIEELSNITNVYGEWRNADEEKLHSKQINRKGKVGYLREAILQAHYPFFHEKNGLLC